MSRRRFEILLVIILVDVFLLSASFFFPRITIKYGNEDWGALVFPGISDLFRFEVADNGAKADSALNNMLRNDSIKTDSLYKVFIGHVFPSDSAKLIHTIDSLIDFELPDDTTEKIKIIKNFLSNYLDDDTAFKQQLIKKQLISYLEIKDINNPNLYNPVVEGRYALDDFFNALVEDCDSQVVRIAHYGDSQIEGDRVTLHIRKKFQERFGGEGAGFVPFDDICNNVSYIRTSSANWRRFTIFHNHFPNSYYGLSGTVFRFSRYAEIKDSTAVSDSSDTTTVFKRFDKATCTVQFYTSTNYSKIGLMYGRSTERCLVTGWVKDKMFFSDTLEPSLAFNVKEISVPYAMQKFRMEFQAENSPDLYGMMIDGNKGIQVDNYALRGHAGAGLMLMNSDYIIEQVKKTNTRLLIFHYGNNVVPYVRGEKACKALEETYYTIFMKFRQALPDISILVIGAGDMGVKSEGEYVSYKTVPGIRDAQRNAAIRAQCAFWDIYEVMGGKGSIFAWSKRGLASIDGHLTNKGQLLIAKELFDAIMIEYNKYRYRPKEEPRLP